MPGTYLIEQRRPGLGRHVNHDEQSRRYPYLRQGVRPAGLLPVLHARNIPVFDQGNTGSCTGQAALGILGHDPYWQAIQQATETRHPIGIGPYNFTQYGALTLYHDITATDPYPGTYPPEDTGSDGLSAARVLTRQGIIPGYEWAFGVDEALRALQDFPLLVGSLWTDSMFEPDSRGLIRVGRNVEAAGGHEWIADQWVPGSEMVGITTSWGTSFGINGRVYLPVEDFARLLAADGDVIVLTPPTVAAPEPEPPAPKPVPTPAPGQDADAMLLAAFEAWRAAKGL